MTMHIRQRVTSTIGFCVCVAVFAILLSADATRDSWLAWLVVPAMLGINLFFVTFLFSREWSNK